MRFLELVAQIIGTVLGAVWGTVTGVKDFIRGVRDDYRGK